MNVFYYNRLLNEPVGGGLHARGLIRALRDLGHTVTCWPHEVTEPAESVVGRYSHLPEIVRVPGLDVRARYRLSRERDDVAKALRESGADIVLARRAAYDYTLDALVAAADVPVIAEVNGVLSKETWVNGGERFLPWERSRERAFLLRAHRVVCVSRDVALQVVDCVGERPNITVVNNGVDAELFHPEVVADSQTLGWSREYETVFGYCGSLSANHDPGLLAAALSKVAEADAGCGFLFVGPTADELRAHGFADDVLRRSRITGLIAHESIPGTLACADVFVGALRHSHGSPLKLFEYMALGKPVVFAAAGQTAEVIVSADCGRVSAEEDADALAQHLIAVAGLDADTRGAMGERGRQWVVNHGTWRTVAAQMIDGIDGPTHEQIGEQA